MRAGEGTWCQMGLSSFWSILWKDLETQFSTVSCSVSRWGFSRFTCGGAPAPAPVHLHPCTPHLGDSEGDEVQHRHLHLLHLRSQLQVHLNHLGGGETPPPPPPPPHPLPPPTSTSTRGLTSGWLAARTEETVAWKRGHRCRCRTCRCGWKCKCRCGWRCMWRCSPP